MRGKPTPEGLLTNSIRSLLKSAGVWHWKNWGGGFGQKGVSDLLGCWRGRMLAIEVKTPTGRITLDQQRFLDNVNAAGGIGFVARDIETVIEKLELWDMFLMRLP